LGKLKKGPFSAGICEVDSRPSSLTPAAFESDYLLANRPVLVQVRQIAYLLCRVVLKTIIIPRQARDRRSEAQRRGAFLCRVQPTTCVQSRPGHALSSFDESMASPSRCRSFRCGENKRHGGREPTKRRHTYLVSHDPYTLSAEAEKKPCYSHEHLYLVSLYKSYGHAQKPGVIYFVMLHVVYTLLMSILIGRANCWKARQPAGLR
jgi:hypothetical protein